MADQDPKDELPPNWISQVLFAALLGVLVFAIILRPDQMAGFTTVPYSDFKSRIVDGEFQSVEIAPTEITGVSQDGSTQRMRALLPPVEDEDLSPMRRRRWPVCRSPQRPRLRASATGLRLPRAEATRACVAWSRPATRPLSQ
ncbi:MAG: ATP-dependent metallopeptidase FtsH/Yme1/Tma family protein, partial [Pseudomonadota bacterium]